MEAGPRTAESAVPATAPGTVIGAFCALFLCQLAGELMARTLALPLPGPVLGALLLFLWLWRRGGPDPAQAGVADGLLTHLGLLFVPADVGVMQHAGRLGQEGPAILLALLASAAASVLVTAKVFCWLSARVPAAPEDAP